MKTKIDKFSDQDNWASYIGQKIIKHSGKPFKSGEKIGTPVEMTLNEHSGREAFKMDDGSVVDCYQTKLSEL